MVGDEAEGEVRRLHPITPFFSLITGARSNIPAAVAIVAALWSRGGLVVVAALGIGAALMLFLHWLGWLRTTYRLTDEELVIDSGLLSRHRRAIPLQRIQDIGIEQNLVQRMFNLARVRMETGGGGADEALLDMVSLDEARRLRVVVRGEAQPDSGAVAAPTEAERETLLYRLGFGQLLLSGLLSFSLFWVAAAFGLLQFLDDFTGYDVGDLFDWLELHRADFSTSQLLFLPLLLVLLGLLSGMIRTILRDFDFRLTLHKGRLRRVTGLLSRGESILSIPRIQMGLVRRIWLRGMLGYADLSVQTLGGSDDPGGRHRIAPFVRDPAIAELMAVAHLPNFESVGLRRVAAAHVPRAFLKQGLLPTALLIGLVIWLPPAWPVLAAIPFIVGAALLQRRYHGYALREDSLQVRRGVLTRRQWVLPYDRIQMVTLHRTLLQRLFGVATVLISTAGETGRDRPDIHDLPVAEAGDVARALIARI
ncbi:PH domain-containing protein [Stakelama tenebrarum]|uniref:PH domain-containing protein n=1 Tax=Stakelama tenebrarum TaxID=2711215 RepID=A0A6G6Y6R9_9SPHN|nr:PH domain-containing protein [Sphingosinithalassobacter tenebrarum]QIG80610.1 PH domain-containing protein [Sphingosinithalassobacter tenebrarum]